MKFQKKKVLLALIGLIVIGSLGGYAYTKSKNQPNQVAEKTANSEQQSASEANPNEGTAPVTPNQPDDSPKSENGGSGVAHTGTQTVTPPTRATSVDGKQAESGKEFISTTITFTNTSAEALDIGFFNIRATDGNGREYAPVKNSMTSQNIQVKRVESKESFQIELTYEIPKESKLQVQIYDMKGTSLSSTIIG